MSSSSTVGTRTVEFTFPIPQSPAIIHTVRVTGTFDDWQQSESGTLMRNNDLGQYQGSIQVDLQKTLECPSKVDQKKLLFKFVIDGDRWVTDPEQELERDHQGNLNNVKFLDLSMTAASVSAAAAAAVAANDDDIAAKPVSSSTTTTAAPVVAMDDHEAEIKRLKEAEDDEIIRAYGGGMWGAPVFAVNDPPQLPEHFVDATPAVDASEEFSTETTTTTTSATLTKEQHHHSHHEESSPSSAASAAVATPFVDASTLPPTTAPVTAQSKDDDDDEAEIARKKKEAEDDAIIKAYGTGLWGSPVFAVNDSFATMPSHFRPNDAPEEDAVTVVVKSLKGVELNETPAALITSATTPSAAAAAATLAPVSTAAKTTTPDEIGDSKPFQDESVAAVEPDHVQNSDHSLTATIAGATTTAKVGDCPPSVDLSETTTTTTPTLQSSTIIATPTTPTTTTTKTPPASIAPLTPKTIVATPKSAISGGGAQSTIKSASSSTLATSTSGSSTNVAAAAGSGNGHKTTKPKKQGFWKKIKSALG